STIFRHIERDSSSATQPRKVLSNTDRSFQIVECCDVIKERWPASNTIVHQRLASKPTLPHRNEAFHLTGKIFKAETAIDRYSLDSLPAILPKVLVYVPCSFCLSADQLSSI
ncbi:11854_t:CDS:2, partial [Rhizophagus irregularis]